MFIYILFLILLIVSVVLCVHLIKEKNKCNDKPFYNDDNEDDDEKKYTIKTLNSVLSYFYQDITNFNIDLALTKENQGRLSFISNLLYTNVQYNNNLNTYLVKILDKHYPTATSNWNIQNIGIPKNFIFALYVDRKNIFKKDNDEQINVVVSLLDKIFEKEQNIRDKELNGLQVVSYNLTYIKLQKQYPNYLKEYDCHKNEEYMKKNYDIINTNFIVKDKFEGNGFYKDYTCINHNTYFGNFTYLSNYLGNYSFLKKYDIYDLNEFNVNYLLNSYKPFINNKIVFENQWSRNISKKDTKYNLYKIIKQVSVLGNDFLNNIELDIINYDMELDKNLFNKNINYLMALSGIYVSYGETYTDNYNINCLNNMVEIEKSKSENNGYLLTTTKVNDNYNFHFGDEQVDKIYNAYNNIPNNKIIFQGALLDSDNEIVNDSKETPWICDIKINIEKIEVIYTFINNIIFFHIIDRTNNTLSIVFYTPNTYTTKVNKICALSVYSKYDILGGYEENNSELYKCLSDLSVRYLYTSLNKTEIINNNLSPYSNVQVHLTDIDFKEDVSKNYYTVSINNNHKRPIIKQDKDKIYYENDNINFTIYKTPPQNMQTSFNNINIEKMFLFESNKNKVLQYCDYPYSVEQIVFENKNFIIDNNYRYYINL